MKLIHISGSRRPFACGAISAAAALALAAGCSATALDEPDEPIAEAASESGSAPVINITRSVAVTDLPTLEALDGSGKPRFSFERVLTQIAATSGVDQVMSAAQLYQRIFDTNNTKAGGYVPEGQHCDDQVDAHGNPTLGGFPLECPRQEGALANLAAHNPFCSGANCDPYTPVAITNRFDLAPASGQTCGQYRIAFGKGTAGQAPLDSAGNQNIFDRNLVIFEAVLPNPQPSTGLLGCGPVMDFWAALSSVTDPGQRAALLDQFFFTGVHGFEPAIKFSHYTGAVDSRSLVQLSGQIRANQFMFSLGSQPWQLREYNLDHACTGTGAAKTCRSRVKLVTPKLNPDASLFDDSNTSAAAVSFRDPNSAVSFLGQVAQLAVPNLNLLNMNALNPIFNGAQSTSTPTFPAPGTPVLNDTNYNVVFNPKGAFAAKIQTRLTSLGSDLSPLQIVRRAQTQACAGCHELSGTSASIFGGVAEGNKLGDNLVWPDPAAGLLPFTGFTQTSEQLLVPLTSSATCDETCTASPATCQCAWKLSAALTDVFLPFRRDTMAAFLAKCHLGS